MICFFFFKQKTAYEIVSRDWSSDVCSSDLDELGLLVPGSTSAYEASSSNVAVHGGHCRHYIHTSECHHGHLKTSDINCVSKWCE